MKELPVCLGAWEHHALAFGRILLRHEASLLDGEGAEALVLRPDSAYGAVGCIPLTDFRNGTAQLGAYGFDERGQLLNGDGVIDGEANVAACGVSSCLCAGLSAEEDSDVGADAAEMLLLVQVETDAEAHEQNDRGDAPHDAEHRQEAAKLRFPERG